MDPANFASGDTHRDIVERMLAADIFAGSTADAVRAGNHPLSVSRLISDSFVELKRRPRAVRRQARHAWRGLGVHPRGHHRAAAGRGQDGVHGPPRRPDRPAQPHPVPREARGGCEPRPAGQVGGRALPRPRQLQGRQRYARSPGRRPPAEGGRRAPARDRPRVGDRRPALRRRIRDRRCQRRESRGRRGPGAAVHRRDRAAVRHRRPPARDRDQHRHRDRADRRHRLGPAAEERRHGALPRQGRRPRHAPLLRARDGRAAAGPPRCSNSTCARR